MLRPRNIIFLIIVLLAFLLYYNDANYSQTVIGAIQNAEVSYAKIIHIKEIKDVAIVFYETKENNFGFCYIKKNFLGWYWVSDGGGLISINTPQSWTYSNRKIGKNSYPVCFGCVSNDTIQNVYYIIINLKDGAKIINKASAEIIHEYTPAKLWYVLLGEADLQFKYAEVTFEGSDSAVVSLYVNNYP